MDQQKPEKRSDVTIANGIASYTVSHQSLNGTLVGTFTFRPFLLPLAKLEAGRDRRRLLGELEQFASPNERYMAFTLSELKQRVITSPSWWKQEDIMGGNIVDEELIFKVGDAALYAESLYQEQKEQEKAELIKRAMDEANKIIKHREEAKQTELKKAKEAHEAAAINKEVDELDELEDEK